MPMADKSPSCTDKTRSASCDIAHSLQPIEQVEHDRSKATKCHLYWKHRHLHQNLKHSRILIDPKQTRNAKKKRQECREREGEGKCAIDDDDAEVVWGVKAYRRAQNNREGNGCKSRQEQTVRTSSFSSPSPTIVPRLYSYRHPEGPLSHSMNHLIGLVCRSSKSLAGQFSSL